MTVVSKNILSLLIFIGRSIVHFRKERFRKFQNIIFIIYFYIKKNQKLPFFYIRNPYLPHCRFEILNSTLLIRNWLLSRLYSEVGIFGKLARSRLAQLANASQLNGLFLSSLATASQLGGLLLSSLAVGRGERAMRARHF